MCAGHLAARRLSVEVAALGISIRTTTRLTDGWQARSQLRRTASRVACESCEGFVTRSKYCQEVFQAGGTPLAASGHIRKPREGCRTLCDFQRVYPRFFALESSTVIRVHT
jgi:hypothetical protein